ncbi:MAG: TlpA family protein disulfide reductase, partial [Paramuribaculum sp.]|nr:TlpA family protein disulfide reductase [Paramuribaculum sp.]
IKKEDFDNWKTMSLLQKKVYNEMCAQSIDGVDINDSSLRHLIDNNLYNGFIGSYVLAYRKNAKEAYDLTVDAYPYEYYAGFLSDVDLKENSFLRIPPVSYTPYYFTYQLIDRLPELKIKDDETIADWRARIAPVVEQLQLAADSEFYDFLVASCYIRNIRESKLLDDFQINQLKGNINEGLFEIIMNENSSMQQSLEAYNAKDLTSLDSFNLESYIKELNLNKPIVVDFWDTWCAPCLDARKQIDRMESDNPQLFEKVDILYISDESSPKDSWEKVSKQFGKTHIRLSKAAIEEVRNVYGFTAIPTYLFFDKDGKLSYSVTGFPGEAKFNEELKKITLPTP